MADITVSFQVIPLCDDPYPAVDRAIEVVQRSGVKHEVGPHETTMEGELDQLLEIVKAGHRACFDGAVQRVITFVKIVDTVGGTTIADKVAKYRT